MYVPRLQFAAETRLLLAAGGMLVLGIAVYVFDRSSPAWFLPAWLSVRSGPPALGPISAALPAFAHAFGAILVTAAVLRPWPRLLALNCTAWLAIECLFEVGQMTPFDARIAATLPEWFRRVPVLDLTGDYFISGTFDYLDISAICLGTCSAFLVVKLINRGVER